MAYDVSTIPAVGDATKRSDYVRLADAVAAVSTSGNQHDLGGSLDKLVSDTSFVDLPDGWECEIDGTLLSGRTVYFEINLRPLAGSAVTGTMDLYNVTTAAVVSSSETAVALSSTNRVQSKSSALTLATGVNRYKARIKGSVGAANPVAGRARVVIR